MMIRIHLSVGGKGRETSWGHPKIRNQVGLDDDGADCVDYDYGYDYDCGRADLVDYDDHCDRDDQKDYEAHHPKTCAYSTKPTFDMFFTYDNWYNWYKNDIRDLCLFVFLSFCLFVLLHCIVATFKCFFPAFINKGRNALELFISGWVWDWVGLKIFV